MKKFLVAYTASHRSEICTRELVLDFDETATPYRLVRKRDKARWEELTKEQQWDLIRMLHKKWEEYYE